MGQHFSFAKRMNHIQLIYYSLILSFARRQSKEITAGTHLMYLVYSNKIAIFGAKCHHLNHICKHFAKYKYLLSLTVINFWLEIMNKDIFYLINMGIVDSQHTFSTIYFYFVAFILVFCELEFSIYSFQKITSHRRKKVLFVLETAIFECFKSSPI